MQRFLPLLHLISVGLGFSPKKGVPVGSSGRPFLVSKIFWPRTLYFLKIPKNDDPLPLIEA
jgi:hypothetical protein